MMSDEDNERSVIGKIEHLEGILQNLKNVALTSENEDHFASTMLEEYNNIHDASRRLLLDMKETFEKRGYAVSERLFSLLNDDVDGDPGVPIDIQWKRFHDKLKAMEGTGEYFRSCCFYPKIHKATYGDVVDFSTILHSVCSLTPPVEVVRTLLALMPSAEPPTYYRRVKISPFDRFGYCPLHRVIQNGGSLEVVKLLVNADHERETLNMTHVINLMGNQKDSVYHMIIANKNMHQPGVFSEILRYLCCVGIGMEEPPLLQQASSHENKIPLLLLVQSLIKEGQTGQHIVRNTDYIFLLKATCFSHKSSMNEFQPQINNLHLICQEIEAISLSEAFLVCAPCFGEKIGDKVLNELLSVDCQFLFKKDLNERYPIHRIITEESYFMHTVTTRLWAGGFLNCILKIILKHAPKSAQLLNDQGRLPLHVVSDAQERRIKDSDRLDLVNIIWNAYPEAAEKLDRKTGLPPFALAARQEEEGPKHDDTRGVNELDMMIRSIIPPEESISSSFFLLRQQPDIILNYIVSGDNTGSTLLPGAKRTKTSVWDQVE